MDTRISKHKVIRQKMAEQELTMAQLAERAKVGLSSVCRATDRHYGKPMLTIILQRIANALGVALDDISIAEQARPTVDATTVAKVLDLRPYAAKQGPYETPLTCYYRFRRFPDCRWIELHAATTSKKGLDVKVHPRWQGVVTTEIVHTETGYHMHSAKDKKYSLIARLAEKHALDDVEFEYDIVFKDGYTKPYQWNYHTHLNFNAGELVMVILFPAARPPLEVTGTHTESGNSVERLKDHPVQPLLLGNGTVLCWRLSNPEQGQTYRVDWTW